jgi:hypothetical protein
MPGSFLTIFAELERAVAAGVLLRYAIGGAIAALQRALASKKIQRQRSARKTVSEKLAIVERMRDRKALIAGRSPAKQGSGASR